MHVETEHLVSDISKVPSTLRDMYQEVPEKLREEARKQLSGKSNVYVTNRALKGWAKKQRYKKRVKKLKLNQKRGNKQIAESV